MPSSCHPYLPQDLVEKFRADAPHSCIFKPEFEKFRRDALTGPLKDRKSIEVEIVHPTTETGQDVTSSNHQGPRARFFEKVECFSEGGQKTWLHLAAHGSDVPLAYEIIRMGIRINSKDKNGITALLLAVTQLLRLHNTLSVVNSPNFALKPNTPESTKEVLTPDYINNKIECQVQIATLIIEQHADVNAGALGFTPISLAIEAGQWDLVELFLYHGARRPRIQEMKSLSSDSKNHLTSILAKTKTSELSARPPQPCPCWSGKLLSQCHDTDTSKPFPAHFLCGCGKRRTYGECCGKRGIKFEEAWDHQDKWIMPTELRTVRTSNDPTIMEPDVRPYYEAGVDALQGIFENLDPGLMKQAVDLLQKGNMKSKMFRRIAGIVDREDDIDPAWWFAMDRVDFFPRPWDGVLSKIEGNKRMNEWNRAVDQYIATQVDFRPRFDIELAAKIGPQGGPLYKHCEAENCEKVEQRDVERMKCCAQCKLVFYCSEGCQRKSWKEDHKEECKTRTHPVQQLDSQWAMEQVMVGMTGAEGIRKMNRNP